MTQFTCFIYFYFSDVTFMQPNGLTFKVSAIPCVISNLFSQVNMECFTCKIRHIFIHKIFRTAPRFCIRSEEHTSELQSRFDLVCRLLLEKKNKKKNDK